MGKKWLVNVNIGEKIWLSLITLLPIDCTSLLPSFVPCSVFEHDQHMFARYIGEIGASPLKDEEFS